MIENAVYIRLTKNQAEALEPLVKQLDGASKENRPGALFAQIYPDLSDPESSYLRAVFLNKETSEKIQKAVGLDPEEKDAASWPSINQLKTLTKVNEP